MLKNSLKSNPKIAIIGGSGLEDPKFFKKIREVKIKTPFGYPSAPIRVVDFNGIKIAFLSRHGKKHELLPHKVPYRANIWALKSLGVETIIAISAVGSLKKNYKPGDIVIPDQFIDFTKGRDYTFFENEAIHTSLADPFCFELRKLFYKEAKRIKLSVHGKGTSLCIEGPRFSTRAESKFFKNFADIIGMTLVPEVILAREAELCYLNISMSTDYDAWQVHSVDTVEVLKIMDKNVEKIKNLLIAAIPKIKDERNCSCRMALAKAKI